MATLISRRSLLIGAAAAGLAPVAGARAAMLPATREERLLARAKAALEYHGGVVKRRDRIAIVDFSLPSRLPRLDIVDLEGGRVESMLVAHGRGSDPQHSGWVERLSNEPGSLASSAGSYLTGSLYVGKHGRSRRLVGLDSGNNNAEARAIVVHGAWYVSPAMAQERGKLGRSEGFFAVDEREIDKLLDRLGEGRLLFADKS